MDLFVSQSLTLVLVSLSLLALSLSFAKTESSNGVSSPLDRTESHSSTASMQFAKNDLLVGLQDPFFWFLAPLFALIAVGVCVVLNHMTMILLHTATALYCTINRWMDWVNPERRRKGTAAFPTSSPRRRIYVTLLLLFFVATLIPYQFAYMVACIVQIFTCIRALKFARENVSFVF
jgi:glycosylphosphatidylinositol deacylase